MKFEFTPFNFESRKISNEALIADLKAVFLANNKNALTIARYKLLGRYSYTLPINRFGSWNKALKAAGLPPTIIINIPVIQLFDNLMQVWEKLGRQPQLRDLRRPVSRYSGTTYRTNFGTWGNALRQFIAFVNEYEVSDANQILAESYSMRGGRAQAEVLGTCRTIGWRVRHLVMKRDHFRCKACGASPAKDPSVTLHVDHILPWSKGGESVIENLQTLCKVCNIGKGDLV